MTPKMQSLQKNRPAERGNILFIILLAVVLIGLLTAAIQDSSQPENANADSETLLIKATEVQRYASELERAITYIRENGISESDIRFAHSDAPASYDNLATSPAITDNSNQVFHTNGGAARYRQPPDEILATSGQLWEFYGGTSVPQVGSDKTDLLAVLPNVTQQFCEKINDMNNLSGQPTDDGAGAASGSDAGDCVHGGDDVRFGNARTFYDAAGMTKNTMNAGSFSSLPARQACVQCADSNYHFYHVLMAR